MQPVPETLPNTLPDTLPEDFGEWDGSSAPANVPAGPAPASSAPLPARAPAPVLAAPAPVPVPAPAPAKKPAPKPVEEAAPAEPEWGSASQVRVLSVVDASSPAPLFSALGFYASKDDPDEEEIENRKRKKKRIVIAISAAAVILLVGIFVFLRFPGSMHGMSASAASAESTDPDSVSGKEKPSPATPLAAVAQPDANPVKITAISPPPQAAPTAIAAEPAPTDTMDDTPQQVEPTMMSTQLNAPKQIPHDINVVPKQEEPPSQGFGASGTEGLGSGANNGVGSVFGGGGKSPKVNVYIPPKVSLAGSVASALLIHKTLPVYPSIARSAGVYGTVVLDITISKTGVVSNLRVVSGPSMLRQTAIDAVNSWRYKPYLIAGQAVEVETTVNVAFTMPDK
jgi:protein TonB